MDKNKLSRYDTTYQRMIINRYADKIPCDTESNDDYHKVNEFMFVLAAPEQYEVERKMMFYAKQHPKCTVKDLAIYFADIVPSGTLPPCASEWEDDE